MLNFFRSAGGILEAELLSADLEGCLEKAAAENIPLSHVQLRDPLTAWLQIRRQDWRKLKKLCDRRGDRLTVRSRPGLYWALSRLIHRPLLLGGIILLLAVFLILPTRVLFFRVSGNRQVPAARILEAAEDCGLRFGVSRRQLRSEKLKNALLQRVPELQWAGINTRGCTAELLVRERQKPPASKEEMGPASMVAVRDGIVDSCTALHGSLLCRPGQAVRAGEILISAYTDCGNSVRAARADGEIYARTVRSFTAVTPAFARVRGQAQGEKRFYTLIAGKKRIKLTRSSGNWDPTCGRMYAEYYITLPGGYLLPLGLGIDRYRSYETVTCSRVPDRVQRELEQFSLDQLRNRMIAGTVLQSHRTFSEAQGLYRLQGQYLCREMIGRIRQEKIGEQHGQKR